jgi:hypothetical protein
VLRYYAASGNNQELQRQLSLASQEDAHQHPNASELAAPVLCPTNVSLLQTVPVPIEKNVLKIPLCLWRWSEAAGSLHSRKVERPGLQWLKLRHDRLRILLDENNTAVDSHKIDEHALLF